MSRRSLGAIVVLAGVLAALPAVLRVLDPERAQAFGFPGAAPGAARHAPAPGDRADVAVKASDLDSLYRSYVIAEDAAWRVFNTGTALDIASTGATRRAAAGRAIAALREWVRETSPPGSTAPAIETALLARRTGDKDAAREALSRLADVVSPDDAGFGIVHLAAGALAEADGDTAAAAVAYQRAAAAVGFVSRDAAFVRLAEARAALGDSSGADDAMRAVLAIDPPSAELDQARAFLAAARLRAGKYDEAAGLAEGIPGPGAKGETKAGQLLLAARIARAQGRTNVARQQYRILFQEFPSLPLSRDAWQEFLSWSERAGVRISGEDRLAGAQVLLRTGREEAGLGLLRQVAADTVPSLRIDAVDKEALYYYGRRRYDPARDAWLRMETLAARRFPSRRADAAIGIARTYRNAGNITEMTRAYQAVMADTTLAVPAARATWELAREYKSLGRFADCEAVLSGYLARFPLGEDAQQALLLRGLCRFLLGRSDQAGEDFRALARRAERRADREAAGYWRARARLEEKDSAGAVESLRAALAYDMPDGYYGYRIRELLDRLAPGDTATAWFPAPAYDPARDPFHLASLASVPTRPRTHYERAYVLGRAGFLGEAQAELARAADLAPSDGAFQEMIAGLANRLGMYSYSMTAARRAMSRADSKRAEARLWRYVYTLGHFDLIEPAAEENGLDPMLVAALIRQESLFDPMALSRAGAKGLMQLMLPTARRVAQARGDALPDEEDLYRPDLSVAYGTHYLRSKLAEFGDNVEVALAAYNAGEVKAREWEDLVTRGLKIPEGRSEFSGRFDPDLFMELIDYSETKDYVRRVRYNQETFHLFYDSRPGAGGGPDRGDGK